MVQLWVNLPAKDKKTTPKYQEITNAIMGRHYMSDKQSFIEVIAGNIMAQRGLQLLSPRWKYIMQD